MLGDVFTFTELPGLGVWLATCVDLQRRAKQRQAFSKAPPLRIQALRSQPSREPPCFRLQPCRGQLVLAAGGTKNKKSALRFARPGLQAETPSRTPAKLLDLETKNKSDPP